MITKEMIKTGFDNNLISIEEEYGGCISLCCRIGQNAFYFIGLEDSDLSVEDYWNSYTMEMTINMIYEILKDIDSAKVNGLDDYELEYYESILYMEDNNYETEYEHDKE